MELSSTPVVSDPVTIAELKVFQGIRILNYISVFITIVETVSMTATVLSEADKVTAIESKKMVSTTR